MKRTLIFLPLLVLPLLLLLSVKDGVNHHPHYTTAIAVTPSNGWLLANKGTADLILFNSKGEKECRWEFDAPATGVVVNGNCAYATTSYSGGTLYCIDLATYDIKYKSATSMGACAPTPSHDGSKIYVCNRYKASVSEVDAASGEILREVKVKREPSDAVVSKDGKHLFVANFLPLQRADVDYVAAEVSVIDCDNFQVVKHIQLTNGSNALRGITRSADGKYILISHNLGRYQVPTSQLQQGWMNTNAVSVIDAQKLEFIGSISLDEPDRGVGGIWDIVCTEDYMICSQSGTHDISIVDYKAMVERLEGYENYEKLDYDLYFLRDIRQRIPLKGNGPRNFALADGKLYIPTYFSDVLNIVDIKTLAKSDFCYNPERVEDSVDRGERAFNDAVLCFQNWQSCNGCHPADGRTDGMNWDLMNDGIGNPKNCKSMLLSFQTPKCMISGIRDNAGIAVRAGYKFIQFCDVEESVAQDVDAYISSLKPLPSPYLVDGQLSQKAEQGKKVFQKYGCGSCHSGEYFTDMLTHRIGEDVEFDQGWDTPTLIEVWRTAPYLFDGRAATMEEVFSVHKHGIQGKISHKDAEALAEYVNSL